MQWQAVKKEGIRFAKYRWLVNFNNDMLTSERLTDRKIISLWKILGRWQRKKTHNKNVSICTVFDVINILIQLNSF